MESLIRYKIRSTVKSAPIYLVLQKIIKPKLVVSPNTDIVIEGSHDLQIHGQRIYFSIWHKNI